ncbi:MAG: hypothetical protein WD016_02530 [Balneolaceae bacterium]
MVQTPELRINGTGTVRILKMDNPANYKIPQILIRMLGVYSMGNYQDANSMICD